MPDATRASLRALSRFLQGAFRHKWTPELKATAKRCRYLVVLAVGRGELAYYDAWSISLEAAAALDASLLLATAHKPMDVLRTASHIDWTTYPAWLEQDKTNAQNRPKRHGLTLWDRAPKGKMGMTDATGERDRQYWSKAKFLSTAALGRKVHSMVTRARCATCLNNEQRCDRCKVERLLARAPELACVGLGHCQCTKIVPGNTMRIEHTIVQWRQRVFLFHHCTHGCQVVVDCLHLCLDLAQQIDALQLRWRVAATAARRRRNVVGVTTAAALFAR
jgi:hypothetical protein